MRRLGRRLAEHPERSVVLAVLLVTTACMFIPFTPLMPAAPLDDSWALGINQAIAQGLTFGRDVIFTFGPYGCVFSRQYHPATDGMMLLSTAYLTITYWLALVELTRGTRRYVAWGFWLVLAGVMTSRDAQLMSYPLLVGVVCWKSAPRLPELPRRVAQIGVAILFSSLGILPLVKGSVSVLCGLIALITCAWFARQKRRDLVVAAVAAPVGTMAVFWLIAGQPLLALPRYLVSGLPLVFGYAEAMAIPGDTMEIVAFLVGSAVLLAMVIWHRPAPGRSRWFLLGMIAAYLFVALKAGFVRHDSHARICGISLVFAALVLSALVESILKPAVLLAAVAAWFYIDGHYMDAPLSMVVGSVGQTYASAWHGLGKRLWDDDALEHEFDANMAAVRQSTHAPRLAGTTDVYSYDQAALLAAGNTWDPRPIMQSYAVWGDYLDAKNRDHLLGAAAPDNILFRVATFDARMPSLDDGGSWPALLTRYRPVSFADKFLVLQHRADGPAPAQEATLQSKKHRFGKRVYVPEVDALVFAEIDVEPSLLGKLLGVLYKPGALVIDLSIADQPPKTYRFIPNIGKLGILVSPLVETTQEFATLYGGVGFLGSKKLTWFTIEPSGSALWWKPSFRVTFKSLAMAPVTDPKRFYELDKPLGVAADGSVAAVKCEGVIDVIAGLAPPPGALSASGMLDVSGWIARSTHDADIPANVVLVLTGPDGKHNLFETRKAKREDVGTYFKDHRLDASGYATRIDVSKLEGTYTLGIGYRDGDRIDRCSWFDYSVAIKPLATPP